MRTVQNVSLSLIIFVVSVAMGSFWTSLSAQHLISMDRRSLSRTAQSGRSGVDQFFTKLFSKQTLPEELLKKAHRLSWEAVGRGDDQC
ncbi:MAG: hypothetical protein AAFV54_02140, partial [Pseudomonadota bacterium]